MYKPVPQVLPHDEDSDNEVDTSIYFDQRFQDDSDGKFVLFDTSRFYDSFFFGECVYCDYGLNV